ncbi:hypothetical protein LWI28_012527 [Acer negundo]|uniref:WAT1-related protein n=1 Tax=Acer negundo TaxID=4023 RepID=A0AAD5JJ98_ACENE|nr:hypothetical protein LWI28_012527 [Acer negundo]
MNKVKPYLAMVSLQFGYAGMYIITMVSLKHGMSHYILAVYRHVVATLIISPFALVLERKIRPKMTLPIFLRIMALGFLEPVLGSKLVLPGDEVHFSNVCICNSQCPSCHYLYNGSYFQVRRCECEEDTQSSQGDWNSHHNFRSHVDDSIQRSRYQFYQVRRRQPPWNQQ